MALRGRIPRNMNLIAEVSNSKGGANGKYLVFAAFSMALMTIRSLSIRAVSGMESGVYLDPESQFAPRTLRLD